MTDALANWHALAARLAGALAVAASMPPPAVGTTPRQRLWTERGATLYRYGEGSRGRRSVPLLIVYSMVNRPYLLDLEPERSLIAALLARGRDVFLLDWGAPTPADRHLSLTDYALRPLERAAEAVLAASGAAAHDLMGVCQGGTLALCHAARRPARVRRLVTMVTPVDFATPDDLLARYARSIDAEALVAAFGNVPGIFLRLGFQSLKLHGNTLGKLLTLADAAGAPVEVARVLRTERWVADSPDQAGQAFLDFIRHFYRDNALVNGTLVVDAVPLRLRTLTLPILNVFASRDHLVPPASSRALGSLVGGAGYREHAFDGGHIGVYLSARAQHEIPEAVAKFLGDGRQP